MAATAGRQRVQPTDTLQTAGVSDFDAGEFRSVLRRFATCAAVAITWNGERPWGTSVNRFRSGSLRPPFVLVAFDRGRWIVPP